MAPRAGVAGMAILALGAGSPTKRVFLVSETMGNLRSDLDFDWMLFRGGLFTSESAISYTMSGFPPGTMAVGTDFIVRLLGSEAVYQVPDVAPGFGAAVA